MGVCPYYLTVLTGNHKSIYTFPPICALFPACGLLGWRGSVSHTAIKTCCSTHTHPRSPRVITSRQFHPGNLAWPKWVSELWHVSCLSQSFETMQGAPCITYSWVQIRWTSWFSNQPITAGWDYWHKMYTQIPWQPKNWITDSLRVICGLGGQLLLMNNKCLLGSLLISWDLLVRANSLWVALAGEDAHTGHKYA